MGVEGLDRTQDNPETQKPDRMKAVAMDLRHSQPPRHGMTVINGRFGFLFAIPLLLLATACSGDRPGEGGTAGSFATLELEAAYPEPFSFLSGVREMPDGSLLAADPLSQVLLRVDLEAGTADTLGGVGGGPQEYQQPDQVFPLPGDSTLLVDLGKTYLTVVAPDGTFHDGLSMVLPSQDGRLSFILPRAVDARGRIYFEGTGSMGGEPQDSMGVSRYDRASETTDVVASAWRTAPRVSRSGGGVSMTLPRMSPNDDWAVGSDGRVAVIRANGYRVEWHLPDGQVVSGPETPYEILPISTADKEAELEGASRAGLAVAVTRNNSGGTSMQMSRGGFGLGGEGPSLEDFEWGETFPPFESRNAMVSPTNDVWVLRWLPADRPPVMDVFGPDGILKGSVVIPERSQLIGFGQGGDVAYFARSDEVDLQWLERYRVVQ